MENIEIQDLYDISCPFCNKKLVLMDVEDEINGNEEFITCEHVIFFADDYGIDYIRGDFSHIIKDVTSNIDEYTAALPITGIRISCYAPSPSQMGTYWGFVKNKA